MDYLYINAIVQEIYKDLPCGRGFPGAYSKRLHSALYGLDCLTNPNISNVLSGYTVCPGDKPPVIVMANVQKHLNSASVGRFTQCIGWSWNSDLLMNRLDEVLTAKFYSESEISEIALAEESFQLPNACREDLQMVDIPMSEREKKAVLTTIMLRWIRYDSPLRIAVPADVDYNSYVISAVRRIYELLPLTLRAVAGFCSYMPVTRDTPECISIIFVPESMADARTLSLSGATPAVCEALCRSTDNTGLDAFIEYVASIEDEDRQRFFEELLQDVEESGDSVGDSSFSSRAYAKVGTALDLLKLSGTLEEKLPQWNTRFFEKREKFTAAMQKRICDQIRESLDLEELARIVQDQCRNAPDDVVKIMRSYRDVSELNSELPDKLWNIFLTFLSESKTKAQIWDLVNENGEALSFILNEERKNALFCQNMEERLQTLREMPAETMADVKARMDGAKELLEQIKSGPEAEETAVLTAKVEDFDASLNQKYSQLNNQQLQGEFEQVQQMPADTMPDCRSAIKRASQLLEKIGKIPNPIAEDAQLQDAVKAFIQKKEDFINSSEAKFQQIEQIVLNKNNYFRILDDLKETDISQLEQAHQTKLREMLGSKRPKQLSTYAEKFKGHFKIPMTLANVVGLHENIRDIVLRDISQLDQIKLQVTEGKQKAPEVANRIDKAMHTAEFLSGSGKVTVEYGLDSMDAEWFRKLLRLKFDSRNKKDVENMQRDFMMLLEHGVFTGNDMLPAIDMFIRCEADTECLFAYILQGKFDKSNDYQYHAAYKMLLEASDDNPRGVLDRWRKQAEKVEGKNENANRAFQKFAQEYQAPGKKKMWPVVVPMSAVILLLAAGLAFLLIRDHINRDIPEETTVPIEETVDVAQTEPVVVYPEEFVFFGKEHDAIQLLYGEETDLSFHGRNQVVLSVLDDMEEEFAQRILELYADHRGTVVEIDDQGSSVAWEEYFFWTCWYYSGANNAELQYELEQKEPSEDVLSVLRVIHYNLPAEAYAVDTPDETQEQTVPTGETEPSIPDAGEDETVDIVPDATGETEATEPEVTQPPITMETVQTAIVEAAERPYVASLEYAEKLVLLCKLFGSEFQLRFENQVEKVNELEKLYDPDSSDYRHFLKHYAALPGDAVIRFDGADQEITWNEYVFWECWVLADRGETTIDANTFNGEFHQEVMRVLSMIYGLVEEADLPANLEELLEAAALPEIGENMPETGETTPETGPAEDADGVESSGSEADPDDAAQETAEQAPDSEELCLMDMIANNAREGYENAQAVYHAIFNQVKRP